MVCAAPLLHLNIESLFHTLGVRVSLSVMDGGMVDESIGAVPITVTLTGELDEDVFVRIQTVDGTGMRAPL